MAILRAGPFASSTESFLNEPATLDTDTQPVNCAMDASSTNWQWKYLNKGSDFILTIKNGFPSDNQSNSGGTASGFSESKWRYQAVEASAFTLTYSGQASGDISEGVSIDVAVNGVDVFSDSGSDSISGTETINIPAAVIPILVLISISFFARDNISGSGNLSYSVSS